MTYDGSTSQYVSVGDIFTLINVITESYTVTNLYNPFLAGYINQYSKIQDRVEDGIHIWDMGDFQYSPDYRTEYISTNQKIEWLLYRYKGISCVLPVESYHDENVVYLADGIRCISVKFNFFNYTFANLQDVLEKFGLDVSVTVSDVEDVGCVWSYHFNS